LEENALTERRKVRELEKQKEALEQRVLNLSAGNFNYDTGNESCTSVSCSFAEDELIVIFPAMVDDRSHSPADLYSDHYADLIDMLQEETPRHNKQVRGPFSKSFSNFCCRDPESSVPRESKSSHDISSSSRRRPQREPSLRSRHRGADPPCILGTG
jgi:hypothetical protein